MTQLEMIDGKKIPIMVRIHGPMTVRKDGIGNIDCQLHEASVPKDRDPEQEIFYMKLGEQYYSVTFSIAEGEWLGSSFFICDECMPKFLAESEACKEEILQSRTSSESSGAGSRGV